MNTYVERYIDAAKDGRVDLLREATRRDLNTPDEDGMTATMWAAHNGNLEALRLIVGRQGDVNASDYLGLSCLHHAVQRGHLDVVSFLTHYGCNLHALDNDHHGALDLAVMHNRGDMVKFLDSAIAQQRAKNPKHYAKLKQDAIKVADANIKRYEKLQDVAEKRMFKEQRKISQQSAHYQQDQPQKPKGFFKTLTLRMKGQGALQQKMGPAPTNRYSDLTLSGSSSAINRKLRNKSTGSMGPAHAMPSGTVRSTSAADVMYLTANRLESIEDLAMSRRPMIGAQFGPSKIYRARSENDILDAPDFDDDDIHTSDQEDGDARDTSMFNRPMGKLSFLPRHNFLGTAQSLEESRDNSRSHEALDERPLGDGEEDLDHFKGIDGHPHSSNNNNNNNNNLPWNQDDLELDDDEDEDDDKEMSTLEMFLCAAGLAPYLHIFGREKIDMQLLMDMKDSEFKELGVPFGPRKRIMEAIARRKAVLGVPAAMSSTRL